MSKRFTRNIRSIENIEKQPKYTKKQNDLLSDDKHVYVRNKDQYEQITGGVKEVNGETPDSDGSVEIDTGAMTVNDEKPDKNGNVTIDTGTMTVNDEKPDENGNVDLQIKDFKEQEKLVRKNQLDEAIEDIGISDRNLIVTSKLSSYSPYSTQPVIEENGRKITINYKENEWESVTLRVDGWKPSEGSYTLSGRIEINGDPVTQETLPPKKINESHPNSYNERFDLLSDGTIIATDYYDANSGPFILHTAFYGLSEGDEIAFYDLQFQPGSVATPWQPSFGDYDAKIKKLEKAIKNLGGSI